MKSIFIATPCYGGVVHSSYAESLLHTGMLLAQKKIGYQVCLLENQSAIDRARNILCSFFNQSGCSHLLFLDADQGWCASDVLKLLKADVDVVSGVVVNKTYDWDAVRQAALGGAKGKQLARTKSSIYPVTKNRNIVRENGLIELLRVGTGYLLISREAVERMVGAYANLRYRFDEIHGIRHSHALFQPFIDGGNYLSEDFAFCERWRRIGGRIWCALDVQASHTGPHTFEPNLTPNTFKELVKSAELRVRVEK